MNRKYSTKKNEKGQGLVEYALTAILATLIGVAVWMAFGPKIKEMSGGLTERVSASGYSVNEGVVYIPGFSPTLTPIVSSIPTDTPVPIASATPTQLACTPGNATHVTSKSACKNLRDNNNCENFNYSSKKDTCSWY